MENQNWNAMLDFSKIPGGIISGLEGSAIQRLANNTNNEFIELDDKIQEAMQKAEEIVQNKFTNNQTNHYSSMFTKFLTDQNLSTDLKNMSNSYLNDYLRFFYSKLRTKDGSFYSPSTLLCIRSSLNRFFNSSVLSKNVNIVNGPEFASCNRMLKSMVGHFLKEGGKVNQHVPIEDEDLQKISDYFTRKNPTALQDEIIFNIIFYFGQRGREHIRKLTKNDFRLVADDNGKAWVEIVTNLTSKNVKPGLNNSDFADIKQCKMFQNVENPTKCPVTAYKMYIQKLPLESNELFPKPLTKFTAEKWYSPKAVRGKDYLGLIMQKLSKQLGLSRTYTNHCIRSTVVTTLVDSGFDTTDVAAVTGHKSHDSMRKYATFKKQARLEELSRTLTESLHSSTAPKRKMSDQTAQSSNTAVTCQPSTSKSCKVHFSNVDNSQELVSSIFGSGNTINVGSINIYYQ